MARFFANRRLLAAAALIAVLLVVALWPAAVPVELATVSRGTLQVTIDEEGMTRVRERFLVSSPVTGRVLRLEFEPGDRVRRGQVVATVRPEMPMLLDERSRADAEASLDGARATLGRVQAEEQRARAALALAERELARTRALGSGGAVSVQQVENREADVRLATEAVNAAAFAVGAAGSDVRRAEARLRAPSSGATLTRVDITAPADGVVLRRLRQSESVVPAGEPLLEIGEPSRLEVVVDLLSTDATRIVRGARAFVHPNAGDDGLEATVRRIEPAGFTKVSALGVEEQRVNVVLDLIDATGEDLVLGDGYRVDVRIVVWQSDGVLTLPTSALFRSGDEWAVYEVRDGRAARTIVEIGHATGTEAEVRSGVSAGSQIVVHPGDRVDDGRRVTARTSSGAE